MDNWPRDQRTHRPRQRSWDRTPIREGMTYPGSEGENPSLRVLGVQQSQPCVQALPRPCELPGGSCVSQRLFSELSKRGE